MPAFGIRLTAAVLAHAALVQAAEPVMAVKGALLLQESFDGRMDLPEIFRTGTGEWSLQDGALRGRELKESHHAAFRKLFLEHRDVVYQVDFKIQGEATARFMINYDLVHLANCTVSKTEFAVTKLAEAAKRAEMEAQAKKNGEPIERGEWQQKPVKFSRPNAGFKEDTWYTLVIELVGDEIVAQLDGMTIHVRHPGLTERKTNFGLQAAGLNGTVFFDNLKVWSATRAGDWPEKRAKLR
jgi:hypothetical protein